MFLIGCAQRAAITRAARSLPSQQEPDILRSAAGVRIAGHFMRIAVDVMGGDHGCGVVIEGAKRALQASKEITSLYLVGNRAEIHAALPEGGFRDHRVR